VNYLLRLPLCAGVLGLLLGGVVYAQPAWLADLGLDFWMLSEYSRELERQHLRGTKLTRQLNYALERMLAKKRIVRDLIDGRSTLLEAAVRLRDLPYPSENFRSELRKSEGGASDDENLCRHLLSWVPDLLMDDPGFACSTLTRLQEELDDQLRQYGTVTLP